MSSRADVEVSANVFQTINNFEKIVYEVPLNSSRNFDILISASGSDYLTNFALDNTINFYFDTTLEMKGTILRRDYLSEGFLRIQGMGYGEKKMAQAMCADQDFTSTNTTGVMNSDTNNILSKTSDISAGTIANQTVNDFRTSKHQNLLMGTSKLCELTGQDFSFDDDNDKIDISDHLGSTSTTGNLVEGVNIRNVQVTDDSSQKIKKVTVIGKGYGGNQVSGTATDGWSQGDAELTRINRNITSNTEAGDLASKILAIEKLTRFTYSFEVTNPFHSFALGDVQTLYSDRLGISGTAVRIVKFKRVITRNSSKLFLTVRGTGERQVAINQLEREMITLRESRENAAMNQPTDDGVSITSVTGAVTSAPSVTSITGTVSEGGSDDSGYFSAGTTTSLTGDNTWRAVTSSYSVPNNEHLFHGVFGSFRIDLDSGAGSSWAQAYDVRVQNTTDSTFYPDSSGIQLNGGFSNEGINTVVIPFYIHIPKKWANKTYRLEYKISNNTNWSGTQEVYYSYQGSRGHTHEDSFDTSDSNHPHGDSFDTSDSNHSHG